MTMAASTVSGTASIPPTMTSASTLAEAPADPLTTNSSSHISTRPPSYGSVVLTLENVLIPKEKLYPSPSARDGLDEETEIFLRVGGCELIQTSGILLKLPQTAMATGQVIFQRFYYSKSFVRQPMETTAMACIYLASKIEEAPRRIRDVINVFHHIRQYRARRVIQPLILDPAYIRLKSDVTLAERRILKELGFCVHVKHPHKIIVMYLKTLDYDQDAKFVQQAWNYMNDALRTNVFVRFTPEAIACACIFLSARFLLIPLPNSPPWYLAFDVDEETVMEISTEIMELYSRPAINYDQLEKKVDTLAKAYQDMKQRGKSSIALIKPESLLTPENTQSPESRPSSPQRAENNSTTAAGIPEILITSTSGKVHSSSSLAKEADGYERTKRTDYSNGDRDRDRDSDRDRDRDRDRDYKRVQNHRESPRGRKRRTPSPIIYNNSYHRDEESPSRHKHKKRKKAHQSSSRSRSRSRSPRDRVDRVERDRGDRRSSKKLYTRDKSPSNVRKHHKSKKSRQQHQHQVPRNRYSSSRSRSRSRDRRTSSKKSHYRIRSPSPPNYSPPPRKSHLKSVNKKSHWP